MRKLARTGLKHVLVNCLIVSGTILWAGTSMVLAGTPTSAVPAPAPIQNSPQPAAPVIAQAVDEQKVRLEDVQGSVFIQRKDTGSYEAAQSSLTLRAGDMIKTEKGSCRLVFEDNAELTMGPDTVLAINEATRDNAKKTRSTLLKLNSGKLKAIIRHIENGSRFEVQTPTAVAAVRGTIFYLDVVSNQWKAATDIYVDESLLGVLFTSALTGDSYLVPPFSSSSALGDGSLNAPRELSDEERRQFIESWDQWLAQNNNQDDNGDEPSGGTGDTGDENEEDDANQDKKSEQNTGSQAVLDDQEKKSGEANDEEDQATRAAEQAMIDDEIGRILDEQKFDLADAANEKTLDQKLGKVFTDVHGNRVRVDQYIITPQADTVEFISLTARTGDYQNGVSAISYKVDFNRDITSDDGPIRNLPWNDYFNVVTDAEMAAKYPEVDGVPVDTYSDQYIVHETAQDLAQGEFPLYPTLFYAEFSNPVRTGYGGSEARDRIRFTETYDDPVTYDFNGDQPYLVQKKSADSMSILQANGYSLSLTTVTSDVSANSSTLVVNGEPYEFDSYDSDGSQTPGFIADINNSSDPGFKSVEYYRNSDANRGRSSSENNFPAYIEQRVAWYDGEQYLDKSLIGLFVPIDDQGHVLESNAVDGSGFYVRGLRDILSPNPLVNGGDYNLEIIFGFGDITMDVNYKEIFTEIFKVDVIVAPESFTQADRFNTVNTSSEFPATLDRVGGNHKHDPNLEY